MSLPLQSQSGQPDGELPNDQIYLPPSPEKPSRRWLWQGKIGPAFWTVASVFSMLVNILLVVILVILARQLFALKTLISDQLLGGLYRNFVAMDQAVIQTSVQVADQIPVQFSLPVSTETVVRLTEDTRIRGARVNLQTGG